MDLLSGLRGCEQGRKFYSELTDELCLAVKQIARYETKDYNGETRRERNKRYDMAELSPEEIIPRPGWEHLWEWFWHLDGQREQGANGPNPLNYLQLDAWQRLTGEIVRREEIQILMAMDRSYLSAFSQERAEQHDRMMQERSKTNG